jgi:hypothetical protein
MAYNSFLFSLRMFRWSVFAYFARRGDLSHSLSLQLTVGRSDALHSIMKTLPFQFTLAPASVS